MSQNKNKRTDQGNRCGKENSAAASNSESTTLVSITSSKPLVRLRKLTSRFSTFTLFVKSFGLKNALSITQSKLCVKHRIKAMLTPKSSEIQRQRVTEFDYTPLISVVAPLYNSDTSHLKEAIDSITSQTYTNWQLVLINASNHDYLEVEQMCLQYAQKDSRIVYKRLEENLGIAGNTNAGLALASGDYITLLDHDDMLHQSALYEIVKEINDSGADYLYTDEFNFTDSPKKEIFAHFKPDYSPDTLRSYNYICHLMVFSKRLYSTCGDMRDEYSGSQDYDYALRLSENAEKISHIAKPLYLWRFQESSFSHSHQKRLLCVKAAKKALADHLKRIGLLGEVFDASVSTCYRIKYEILGEPLVTIIIPNFNHMDDLKKCLDSIMAQTTYPNYEIIVVENNSTDPEIFKYYEQLDDPRISILKYEGGFNFSAINNFAAREAKGKYLLFLNNDTEVITPEWLEEMLMYAQRDDVGAVGAKLYYPDDTIQHAGVILGIGGTAGHSHRGFRRDEPGYSNRLKLVQNVSAVTGACLMVSKSKFDSAEGFTECFAVALNDVDLCLKLRELGYLNVFTPFAELYHFESKSRGYENSPEKKARFIRETQRFHERWGLMLAVGDPYYNPNLTSFLEDFSIR